MVLMHYGTDYTCPHGEQWGDCCPKPLRAYLVDTYGLDNLPAPTPVVAGVLYADSLAWLQGKPGHGKSFVALDIAGCVATGETWQGNPTTPGTVLYVVAEGATGLLQRVRAWEQAYGRRMDNVQFLPVAVQANEKAWPALIDLANVLKPTMVVVDTQARVTVGRDENSAQDMGEFVARLDALRKVTRACVLVVHHQGRAGEHMRGSTALEGAATTIISCAKDDTTLTIGCSKQKDAAEFEPFNLRMVPGLNGESVTLMLTDGTVSPGTVIQRCGRWLRAWRETFRDEWVSVSTIIDTGIVPKNTFHTNKFALLDAGAIEKSGDGRNVRYRLAVRHES